MTRNLTLILVSLAALAGLSSCGPLESGSNDMLLDAAPQSGNAQYENF